MNDLLGIVLAGGAGERLKPLTTVRAKPAVPFGGKYRIIDFVLNSMINSGIRNIKLLVQTLSQPLINHVSTMWPSAPVYNYFVQCIPAQKRMGEQWYKSTADAVYQNLNIFRDNPCFKRVAIFSGDHIFKMDASQFDSFHRAKGADFTISAMVIPKADASRFGIVEVDQHGRVIGFEEKPAHPKEMPGRPGYCLTSMGNYIANIPSLVEMVCEDAGLEKSSHDFGKDIIPHIVKNGKAVAHRFTQSCVRSTKEAAAYWRDVGTVDAYWEANLDLCDILPALDLYDNNWPIWTYGEVTPPAKFVHDEDGRRGMAVSSLVSGGCIVSGASLKRSLLFTGVRVNSYTHVEDAVVMPYVEIGRNARLKKVVIDRGVVVPDGLVVGEDPVADAQRFRRTENGVCLITKPMIAKLPA